MANLFTGSMADRLLARATELSGANSTESGIGTSPSSTSIESGASPGDGSSTQVTRTTQPGGVGGAITTRHVFMLDVDILDDPSAYLG